MECLHAEVDVELSIRRNDLVTVSMLKSILSSSIDAYLSMSGGMVASTYEYLMHASWIVNIDVAYVIDDVVVEV